MPASAEQQAFINHQPTENARVLAGPGTGKSWTAVQFLERLAAQHPKLTARMLTFTRAATAEFAKKLGDANLTGLGARPPATIHAFALGQLMSHPHACGLPQPLRIAGKWESENLIRPALRNLLRGTVATGDKITVKTVERLEEWMSAGWESLDPEIEASDELDPRLVNAFTGIWNEHRDQFGYALIGEVPYRAMQMLEDLQLDSFDLDVLLVDEYQDLNRADIRLLEIVAQTGVALIAIGDDDQSIYSFRMAHPEGIRIFLNDFAPAANYPLTESHRCGGAILDAAAALIEADPARGPKQRLTAKSDGGTFAYLRFSDEDAEIEGVANIIAHRIQHDDIPPSEIAILVRSSLKRWAKLLTPALEQLGITLASTDWVDTAIMKDDELRRGLALAWLAIDENDSLAWWTLLKLTSGVGESFVNYVADERRGDEPFASTLLRLHEDDFPGGRGASKTKAAAVIDEAREIVRKMDVDNAPQGELGWGGWLLQQVDQTELLDESERLLELVGGHLPEGERLGSFLGQLEPLGRDLAAAEAEGVRLMTMASSKGLTVNTAISVGVEDGLIPMPPPKGDPREERRLLYVAMTRATDMCLLTWAARRTGTLARLGTPSFKGRRQSPLLRDLPAIRSQGGETFVEGLRSL